MSAPPATELTTFTKSGGPLTKRISLQDGKINSDGSGCRMAKGYAQRAAITDAHSLADLIASLRNDQALALGRLRNDLPDRVAVVTKNKLNGCADVIARTSEYIGYRSEAPAYAPLRLRHEGHADHGS